MKRPVTLIVSILLAGLASCSTQYGCKGLPEDPACLSAVEAYRITDKANSTVRPSQNKSPTAGKPGASMPSALGPASALAGTVAHPANSAPNPNIDDPTPIRTPSKVMRIWVAPWEDADGDLNVSGYLFTELEPRRWMVGKAAPTVATSLKPLQVIHREKEKKSVPSNADQARIDEARPDGMTGPDR